MVTDEKQTETKKARFSFKRVGLTVLAFFLFFDVFVMYHGCIPTLLFGGQRGAREHARRAACISNMKTLAQIVSERSTRTSLEGMALSDLVADVAIDDPRLLRCPSAENEQISYRLNPMGLNDPEQPLIVESPGTHPSVSVGLFAATTSAFDATTAP